MWSEIVDTHKIDGIYACAFRKKPKNCVVLLNLFIAIHVSISNYKLHGTGT